MLHLSLTATTEVQNTQHTIFLFIHVYKQRSVGLAQTASRLPDISPGHYLRDTNPIEHVNNTRNVTPITLRTFETPPSPHIQHHLRYFSCVSVCLCFQWLQPQQLLCERLAHCRARLFLSSKRLKNGPQPSGRAAGGRVAPEQQVILLDHLRSRDHRRTTRSKETPES